MKRWPLRIIVCLILGAITTVAVAWAVHYWPFDGTHDRGERTMFIEQGDIVAVSPYTVPVVDGWPRKAIVGIDGTGPQPIWPEFVIDTLFYAAIWGGVFFGVTIAKRFIRIKRNRCPRCGYDLRGQRAEVRDQRSEVSRARAGCPECGWGRESPHSLSKSEAPDDLISVRPKNYRKIALYALSVAREPVAFLDRRHIADFSERGPLTQRGIRACKDFEIRDGSTPILGFHDHPDEMWIAEPFSSVAKYCMEQGWLTVAQSSRQRKV